ncbi:MAG: ADP-forming succinate--CoA ligase subunit beta [Pirellulales bacterium]|nr:ADP-forming succinate--CoA ligase subunit beta [Pirellulales bacterium]
MKIHEYQAKKIFREAGVEVPRGIVADSPRAAGEAFAGLGGPMALVKAQIHAGGRGKGTIAEMPAQRGVQIVRSREEAETAAGNLLGHRLVTIQTGAEGKTVHRVLVEEGCSIAKEFYLGAVVDRGTGGPVLIASPEGGMEIEHVAAAMPDRIFTEPFNSYTGVQPHQIRKLAWRLGLPQSALRAAEQFVQAFSRVFLERDCSLLEINPLALTADDRLLALDAKMSFDDSALFRHADSTELRDLAEEEPAEVRAGEAGLSYVKLDGNIGCLVNGAGLAMSTMDLIKLHGGEPANFLDVGGGANVRQVIEAFHILLGDASVRAVLVNIFGGIMQCTTIADALLEAYRTVHFTVPLVVRLEGTEVEQGRRILAESELNIIAATDLTDAAQKVVAAASRRI